MPSDRATEGGESAPRLVEQGIAETRADRDAWRAANWPSIDLANRPDGESWDREPEPLTAEERARLEPDTYPAETDTENPATGPEVLGHGEPGADSGVSKDAEAQGSIDLPAPTDESREKSEGGVAEAAEPVLAHSDRHPRATIVFSDTEMSPDPGRAYWSSSDESPASQPTDEGSGSDTGSGTGEAASESTYKSSEDVREALMEGKSVSEVRRGLAEQQSESGNDPSSEVVRRQGDLRLERGASQVDADLSGEKTVSETNEGQSQLRRLERLGMTNASDLGDAGKHYVRFGESLLESPKPTGAYTREAWDRPYIQEAPREAVDGGNMTVACIALAVVTREGLRKLRGWVDRVKERRDGDH